MYISTPGRSRPRTVVYQCQILCCHGRFRLLVGLDSYKCESSAKQASAIIILLLKYYIKSNRYRECLQKIPYVMDTG